MASDHQAGGVGGRTMKLTRGAGQPHEIPLDVAALYHGGVEDVLRRLEREHIHDGDLRAMLENADGATVFELFAASADGTAEEEAPVSPYDAWENLVAKAQEQDVELGVARAHKGGW